MVKLRWGILLLSGIVALYWGCDPVELPEPGENDPVFTLSGTLGGTPFDVAAGVDQYFMFTDVQLVNDGEYVVSGRLEELGCQSDCNPGWQIEFRAAAANLDSLLSPGLVSFQGLPDTIIETAYRLQLEAVSSHSGNAGVQNHQWALFDGSAAEGPAVDIEIPGSGLYPVSLTTVAEDSCYSFTAKNVAFDLPGDSGCAAAFTLEADSLLLASYTPTGGVQPISLLWQDSIPGEIISFFPQNQPETICLEAIFENCSARACQSYLPSLQGAPAIICSNDFTASVLVDTTLVVEPVAQAGVTIRHIAADGTSYSSDAPQGSSAYFRITEAEPYEDNNQGQPTVRLSVEWSCRLYNEQGEPWRTVQAEGTIAVALPE